MIHRAVLLTTILIAGSAFGQSTAFTFQGRLEDEGVPASGIYDMRFRLLDDDTGGFQFGPIVCKDNVQVDRGLFSVQLDFDQQYNTVDERHLEVQVRRDTGFDCANITDYSVLFPRQQLTATPIASYANVAEASEVALSSDHAERADAAFRLDAPDGNPTNAVFVNNAGNVGVGTISPLAIMDIRGGENTGPTGTATLRLVGSNAAQVMLFDGNEIDVVADGLFLNNNTNQNIVLANGGGNVGIGTTGPGAKLDVRGNIKLGTSGEYFATSSGENLRVVRGKVSAGGGILEGSGFTVAHPGTGDYTITFNTAFADLPVVTASVEWQASGGAMAMPQSNSNSVVSIVIVNTNGSLSNRPFFFIAVGPR